MCVLCGCHVDVVSVMLVLCGLHVGVISLCGCCVGVISLCGCCVGIMLVLCECHLGVGVVCWHYMVARCPIHCLTIQLHIHVAVKQPPCITTTTRVPVDKQ